jgi:hypothetical protein
LNLSSEKLVSSQVRNWFQAFAFKFNLYRYTLETISLLLALKVEHPHNVHLLRVGAGWHGSPRYYCASKHGSVDDSQCAPCNQSDDTRE